MDESRLERTACMALSSMVMNSLAWVMEMGSDRAAECRESSARSVSSGPTKVTGMPKRRAAWIAPSISGLGARSVPIASRAMTPGMAWLRRFLHFQDFASLVVPALRACAVRQLAFVAIRTLGGGDAGQGIMSAAGRGAALGVPPFGIRHGNPYCKLSALS